MMKLHMITGSRCTADLNDAIKLIVAEFLSVQLE
jgi:hypothetical protein